MGKEERTFCFVGANSYSFGTGMICDDGELLFRLAGMLFGGLVPVGGHPDFSISSIDLPEYNPAKRERTGKICTFVFMSLEGYKRFSFKGTTSEEFKIQFQTMEADLLAYKNNYHRFLEILETLNIDDFDRKKIESVMKFSRSISNTYQPTATPQK